MRRLAMALALAAWAAGLLVSAGVAQAQRAEPAQITRPVIVYINRSDDDRYHVKGCGELQEGFAPVSLQNAKDQGYRPCPVCKPPE